ncbi:VOC family protein [Flavobacterium sp. DG1-102-2]|uniref:VOC family protein n=1 Tax=Flavobacterium sp. DG1-102-2 TaxID=3081663 RepID=UPI002949E930|nr:VOC family protein [Flavobacterium sp. DG1-102-2]MDV6168700.1 VOC family protein [Flavobacterium sp. DG1-102-2]
MNTIAYFEIQAYEPERAIAFYSSVFGWEFTQDKELPIEYYRIATTGMHGGLLKRPAPAPGTENGTNAYTCSIEVENFDDTADKIMAAGGEVALPKFAIHGKCWQGYFIDTDNNTFGIFQVDDTADNSTF